MQVEPRRLIMFDGWMDGWTQAMTRSVTKPQPASLRLCKPEASSLQGNSKILLTVVLCTLKSLTKRLKLSQTRNGLVLILTASRQLPTA